MTVVCPCGVNAVLVCNDFPELGANLVAAPRNPTKNVQPTSKRLVSPRNREWLMKIIGTKEHIETYNHTNHVANLWTWKKPFLSMLLVNSLGRWPLHKWQIIAVDRSLRLPSSWPPWTCTSSRLVLRSGGKKSPIQARLCNLRVAWAKRKHAQRVHVILKHCFSSCKPCIHPSLQHHQLGGFQTGFNLLGFTYAKTHSCRIQIYHVLSPCSNMS